MTTWYRNGICMEPCVSWLCVNVAETAGCANTVARNWLSGRCCERVEFVTVSVEIQSEDFFCSLDANQAKST